MIARRRRSTSIDAGVEQEFASGRARVRVSYFHTDFDDLIEYVSRADSVQTVPVVCMHCEQPTCAEVCPADAIKQNEDGVVQSSLKPRCIGCSNCVLACPFGVPKYMAEIDQMMKCDMCTDRTSEGYAPMCASVCPSEALWYGTIDEYRDALVAVRGV